MQQPQETTAEAKAHGIVDLGLKLEGGVIQLQLLESLTQVLQTEAKVKGTVMTVQLNGLNQSAAASQEPQAGPAQCNA